MITLINQIMELGDVYKEDGDIAYEKLFYFHFREMPNNLHFVDVDGCAMVQKIVENFEQHIKEEKQHLIFDNLTKKYVLVENRIVFNSHELMECNSYYFSYYYSSSRILSNDYLKDLALKYANKSDTELF